MQSIILHKAASGTHNPCLGVTEHMNKKIKEFGSEIFVLISTYEQNVTFQLKK